MLGELARHGPVLGPVTRVVRAHSQLVDVQRGGLARLLDGEELDGEDSGHPEAGGHRAADALGLPDSGLIQARGRGEDLGAHAVSLDGLDHGPAGDLAAGAARQQDRQLAGEGHGLLQQQAGHGRTSQASPASGLSAAASLTRGSRLSNPLTGLALVKLSRRVHQQDPVTVVTASWGLDDQGPSCDLTEGEDLSAHLLLAAGGLAPPRLRQAGLRHRAAHRELVTCQLQGSRGGLDRDPLVLKLTQQIRVLVLMLEGEDVSGCRGLQAGSVLTGPSLSGHHPADCCGVVGQSHGRVHGDLGGRAVRSLDERTQVDAQCAGLLLHHAGQLASSDDGHDGLTVSDSGGHGAWSAHRPRLPAP